MVWFWIQFWFSPCTRLCPPPSVRPGLAQKGPVLGFLLYSILKCLVIFEQGTPPFHLALGLTITSLVLREASMFFCVCVFSCVWLCATPSTVVCQAPQSMGFSRQEYWSRLPFPPPEDLPDSGIAHGSSASRALRGGFFTTEPPGKPCLSMSWYINCREFSDLGSVIQKRTRGFPRWGRSTDLNAGASSSWRARSCSHCIQRGS